MSLIATGAYKGKHTYLCLGEYKFHEEPVNMVQVSNSLYSSKILNNHLDRSRQ